MSLIYSCNDNDACCDVKNKYKNYMQEWKIDKLVSGKDIWKNTQVFLFDLDGVLWHGDTVLEGATELVNKLMKNEKQVYFITNNSMKSTLSYVEKFHKLGFPLVQRENIICTSYAISKYLHDKEEFSSKKKKVYVIGEKGLCDELDSFGLEWIGGYNDDDKKVSANNAKDVIIDKDVGAVVVGMDFNINYYKIQYAQLCISQLDAEFIVSNKDPVGNFTPSQIWVGTGSMVSSIENSVFKKPNIIGKPNLYMFEDKYKLLNVNKSQIVMIGDRLETDILFAKNLQIKSILVSSGVTDSNIYLSHNHLNIKPDYIMKSVAELL